MVKGSYSELQSLRSKKKEVRAIKVSLFYYNMTELRKFLKGVIHIDQTQKQPCAPLVA